MIYIILVVRVYSLTLYYDEFDKVRKYSLTAPFVTIRLLIYSIAKREYSLIKNCFVFHLPTTYVIIGLQNCLLHKEYQDKKKAMYLKYNKNERNKILLKKTEKLICQT